MNGSVYIASACYSYRLGKYSIIYLLTNIHAMKQSTSFEAIIMVYLCYPFAALGIDFIRLIKLPNHKKQWNDPLKV